MLRSEADHKKPTWGSFLAECILWLLQLYVLCVVGIVMYFVLTGVMTVILAAAMYTVKCGLMGVCWVLGIR